MTWKSSMFSEVAEFRNGLNFVKTDNGKSVKIIGVSDFQDHIELESLDNLEEIRVKGELRHEDILQNDDLLFVRSNGNKELIGRCMIIHVGTSEVSYSGFTIRARLKSNKVLPRFLVQLFRTIYIKRQIQTVGGGTNISNLSQGILSNLIIPIPPLPEQRKIVEILSSWDKAIALLEQLITAKRKLKQGLMQQLLTGKKRFKEFEGSEWKKICLEDISEIKSGFTPSRSQSDRYFIANGIPWVKTMDLNNNYIYSTNECITEIAIKESSCFVFSKGTVLVAMYGGFNQIGRTGILQINAAVNQAISAIQLNQNKAIPDYVLHWLNAKVNDWREFAASSRKDPNITRKDICKFPILLPIIAEQQKIASILSAADAEISNLEKQLAAYKQQKRGLMQQLLTGKKRVKLDEPQMLKV